MPRIKTKSLSRDNGYFASVNSGDGFISYFPEIFSNLDRLYIIKGGSGTGKSKLITDIANTAKAPNRRCMVEYFYCSADPSSLDGIIISDFYTKSRIGVIDGTAPHVTDPKYPGAYDEIINVGDFWDTDSLVAKKDKIFELIDKKTLLYRNVYRFLSISSQLLNEESKISEQALDKQKMLRAVDRIMKKIPIGTGYKEYYRLTDGITIQGIVHFDTFERKAETNYCITDNYGTAGAFINAIKEAAKQRDIPVFISTSPLYPSTPNAIFMPDNKISFRIGEPNPDDKIINIKRFCNNEILKNYKNRLRFLKNSSNDLLSGAVATLAEIGKLHNELEQIYISAMDFERKEEFTKGIIKKIIKPIE